jgi:hypothetical protein
MNPTDGGHQVSGCCQPASETGKPYRHAGYNGGVYICSKSKGRCYDHSFLRFSTIFSKKLAFSTKTNVTIKFVHDLALSEVKNANFCAKFFGKKQKSVSEQF